MSKYKNKLIVVDDITFLSQIEAKYYQQLKWAKEGKTLKSFELQPKFILQDKFKKNGKHYRAITYTADFLVTGLDGKQEVIDIKGFPDQKFKIKQKLFEYKFPDLTLKVLYWTKKLGWHEK